MFSSRREKWAAPEIVALVELDLQKMRLRLIWAREAIRERLQELEVPGDHRGSLKATQRIENDCETKGGN
jgi:hypothetical protein